MKITPELLLQLGFELEEKKEHAPKNLNVYSINFENITDLKYNEWNWNMRIDGTSISLNISFFIESEKITLYVGSYNCKIVQTIEEALQFICETSIKFGKQERSREFKKLLEL
jgi:hypothetical protein